MGMGMPSNMVMLMVVLFACYGPRRSEGIIGINWGRQSAQRLLPSQVVDLLLQNGIKHARIYASEPDMLSAFVGTGIELSISIFRASLIDSVENANKYVDRVMPFIGPSNIRNIYMGGYPFEKPYNISSQSKMESALKSLQILQNALNERRFEDGRRVGEQVKVTLLNSELSIKRNITKPSEAEFEDLAKPVMMEYINFLRENNASFPFEFMPILDVTMHNDFGIDFAFADNKSKLVIEDTNGAVYTNIFEWQYDCFAWALNKLNASDLKIVVTQVGWPSDGISGASVANAERFFKHLLPLVASDRGTPMRPGAPIDIFVHSLTDETKMVPFGFTRHWGIYRSNGEPKYKIDLTGRGRDDVTLTTVKGIIRMPTRWCVFNGDRSDPFKVNAMVKWACANTDCSTTEPGSSCGKLTFEQNVSFVFNMFFQFQFQEETACFFNGLGTISIDNPSTGECIFPVEVVKGRQRNFVPRPPEGYAGQIIPLGQ